MIVISHVCTIEKHTDKQIHNIILRNKSIGNKSDKHPTANPFDMFIPEFVVLVILHQDVPHQFRPGDQVVAKGQNCECHIKEEYYECCVLLAHEHVAALVHHYVGSQHPPHKTLIFEHMCLDDDGGQFYRCHTLLRYELLQICVCLG